MQLRQSWYGCYVGPHFIGCVAYADDLVLLSSTRSGLQSMLRICQIYSQDYKVQFNIAKSQFILFDKVSNREITINIFGTLVQNQMLAVHLGHKLYADSRCDDLDRIIGNFYRQYNAFRCRFGQISSVAQAGLFSTNCCSFYGCMLLPHCKIEKLSVAWRKTLEIGLEASLANARWSVGRFISDFMLNSCNYV